MCAAFNGVKYHQQYTESFYSAGNNIKHDTC
jgi:hypothetical protein